MVISFETQVVHALQRHFTDTNTRAIAYRYRQMHWCSQFTDIAVDSPIPKYYLGIECKSIQTKKLYFSAHFQKDQIANMNMFLEKSGRTGYLGIEFRHRGTKSEAYLVPWHHVALKLENGESGVQKLEVPLFENVIQLTRIKEGYLFPSDF